MKKKTSLGFEVNNLLVIITKAFQEELRHVVEKRGVTIPSVARHMIKQFIKNPMDMTTTKPMKTDGAIVTVPIFAEQGDDFHAVCKRLNLDVDGTLYYLINLYFADPDKYTPDQDQAEAEEAALKEALLRDTTRKVAEAPENRARSVGSYIAEIKETKNDE